MFNVNTKSKSIQMKNTKSVFPLKDFIFISLDTKICRKSSGPVWSLSSWMTSASDWQDAMTKKGKTNRHVFIGSSLPCAPVLLLPSDMLSVNASWATRSDRRWQCSDSSHTHTHSHTHKMHGRLQLFRSRQNPESVTFPCEREGFSVSRLPRGRKPLHILTIQAELPVGGSSSGALWADAKKKPPAILQHDIFRCRTETSLQDLTDFTIRLKHSSALTLQVFFLCIVFIIKSPK